MNKINKQQFQRYLNKINRNE